MSLLLQPQTTAGTTSPSTQAEKPAPGQDRIRGRYHFQKLRGVGKLIGTTASAFGSNQRRVGNALFDRRHDPWRDLFPECAGESPFYWEEDSPFQVLVCVPSLSYNQEELKRIKGVHLYEQRFLYHILLLARHLELRVVLVTSTVVDPHIIDYYVELALSVANGKQSLQKRISSESIKSRLVLLDCGDSRGGVPLSSKILSRPLLVKRIQREVHSQGACAAAMACIVGTSLEAQLATVLNLPLLAASPSASATCGTKSGSRSIFEAAGVRCAPGTTLSFSVGELARKLAAHVATLPRDQTCKLVVKLDESFSGQGNAVLKLQGGSSASEVEQQLPHMKFMGIDVTWDTYAPQIALLGVIAEEFIPGVAGKDAPSPSGQGVVGADGSVLVLSTHDQILRGHTYLGCSFPSSLDHAGEIAASTRAVGDELAARGCLDHYGCDFMVGGDGLLWAIEINLRHCGTTHPYMTLQALTGGAIDESCGSTFITASGKERYYLASDNMYIDSGYGDGHGHCEHDLGIGPQDLIECVLAAGLAWSVEEETGVVLHMLASASEFGKYGCTAIAASSAEARALFEKTADAVNRMAHEAANEACEWQRARLLQHVPSVGILRPGSFLSVDDDLLEFGVDPVQHPDARKVVITCASHGNETCGALGVNELIHEGFLQDACMEHNVALTVILGNPRATAQHRRFADVNLNRCFVDDIGPSSASDGASEPPAKEPYEYGRARFLMEILQQVQPHIYLDLHSCSALSPPFALPMDTFKSACLAGRLPVRAVVQGLAHATTAKGTSLDWMLTHMAETAAVAVECGRHDARSSVEVAKACIRAVVTGSFRDDDMADTAAASKAAAAAAAAAAGPQLVWLRMNGPAEFVPDKHFQWARAIRPFEFVTEGQVLAFHGEEQGGSDGKPQEQQQQQRILAKRNGVLVMPTLLPVVGEEAFFLCEETSGPVEWDDVAGHCIEGVKQPSKASHQASAHTLHAESAGPRGPRSAIGSDMQNLMGGNKAQQVMN